MYVTNTMIETKMLVKMSVSFQINQSNPRSFREISFHRWTIPLANIFPACFNLFTRAFIRWNSREFRVCEVREEKWKIVAGKICGKFGGNLRSFRQSKNGAASRGSLWARIFETVPRKFAYLEPSDERDSGVTRPNKTISRLVSSHSPIRIFPPCLYPLHTSNDASAIPFILRLNLRRFCFAILFRDLPCDTL